MCFRSVAAVCYLKSILEPPANFGTSVLVHTLRRRHPGAARFVPEGTAINLPPYVVHRDAANFSPLPDSFIPERWLRPVLTVEKRDARTTANTTSMKFHTDTAAFFPFSLGPMNCAGKNLALLQMRVVVCTLVRRFDMQLSPGYEPWRWEDELHDWLVFTKGQLPVVLTPRKL